MADKIKIIPLCFHWHGLPTWLAMLYNRHEAVLIDSCIPGVWDGAVAPALKKAGLGPQSLLWVINTHCHEDHTAGNFEICRQTSAATAIHKAGAQFCSPAPALLLSDGDIFDRCSIQLEIIHTPGHSPDSVCILEPESGILFSGDSIQGEGIRELGVASWSDSAVYRNSIFKIQRMRQQGRISQIITGHEFSPCSGIVGDDEVDGFLQASLDTVDRYRSIAQKMKHNSTDEVLAALRNCKNWQIDEKWTGLVRPTAEIRLQEALAAE